MVHAVLLHVRILTNQEEAVLGHFSHPAVWFSEWFLEANIWT